MGACCPCCFKKSTTTKRMPELTEKLPNRSENTSQTKSAKAHKSSREEKNSKHTSQKATSPTPTPKLTVELVHQIKEEIHRGQEGEGVHPDTVDMMIMMLNKMAEEGIPRRKSRTSMEPTHPKPVVLQKLAMALLEGKTAEGIDQNDLEAALYILELAVGQARSPKPTPVTNRKPPPPLKILAPTKFRNVEQHDENYITVPRNRLMPEEQEAPKK